MNWPAVALFAAVFAALNVVAGGNRDPFWLVVNAVVFVAGIAMYRSDWRTR